jgi:hypothetical protein
MFLTRKFLTRASPIKEASTEISKIPAGVIQSGLFHVRNRVLAGEATT